MQKDVQKYYKQITDRIPQGVIHSSAPQILRSALCVPGTVGLWGYRMSSVPGVDRVEECRHVETGGTKGQDLGVVQGDPRGDLKDTGELAKLALGEGGRRVGEKEDRNIPNC